MPDDASDFHEAAAVLAALEDDANFFMAHFDELRRQYKDQYVAIRNHSVVAHGRKMDAVLAELREQDMDPVRVVVEFCPNPATSLAF